MKKKPNYSELIKEFLTQHVADFKALPRDEAMKRALGQHMRGKEHTRIQREKLDKKPF